MKKAAVCMAAFYLLLITGMYACIVSCGSGHIKDFLASNFYSSNHKIEQEVHCAAESEKHCDGEEGCPCCEKHGKYTVKENIKPDSTFELLQIPALAVSYGHSISYNTFSVERTVNTWPNSHAPPPPGISPPIYIKILSLLI